MTHWATFATVLAVVQTSLCSDDAVSCGVKHNLESTPLTMYGESNESMTVTAARSAAGMKLQWRLNVRKSMRRLLKVVSRGGILISNITGFVGKAIRYELVFANDTSRIFYSSGKGWIQIGGVPTIRLTSPSNHILKLMEGDNATICFALSGDPPPTLTLKKGPHVIPTNSHSTFHFKQSCLTINSILHKEKGSYELLATNCVGTAKLPFRLKVFVKPSVKLNMHGVTGHHNVDATKSVVTVVVDGNLTIPFRLSGFPNPTIRLLHRNSSLGNFKLNQSHITLRNVSKSDAGVYRVVVSNNLGEASEMFNVQILPDYSSSVSETGKDIENTSDLKGNESIATHSTRETGGNTNTVPTSSTPGNPSNVQSLGCKNSDDSTDEDCSDDSGLPWWIPVLITLIVVIVIVVVLIVFICLHSAKYCGGKSTTKCNVNTKSEQGESPSGSWKHAATLSSLQSSNKGESDYDQIAEDEEPEPDQPKPADQTADPTDQDVHIDHIYDEVALEKRASTYDHLANCQSAAASVQYDEVANGPTGNEATGHLYDHIPGDEDESKVKDGDEDKASITSKRSYALVDYNAKKRPNPDVHYSSVHRSKTNTARYAELDEDAMEQPLPAPLRYSAVEYADLNEVQPAARQE